MKPDGIHFKKGMIKGFDFNIYLDLSEPKEKKRNNKKDLEL